MSVKRDNLIKTAELLFYEYGFRGVGLKQIISEANIATMTLYNHFESKEHLIEAVLKHRGDRYWSYMNQDAGTDDDSPLISAVAAHGEWLKASSFKGDMFLRAIEDYEGSDNNIENIARAHKGRFIQYFENLARGESTEAWEQLTNEIVLLLEGTTSMTTLIGPEKATEYSITMARNLLRSTS